MIKTAEEAYLAGRQAAMEKIAMSNKDKVGYGLSAGIGAGLTFGAANDRITGIGYHDSKGKFRPDWIKNYSSSGRLGKFLKRNKYALPFAALGAIGFGGMYGISRGHLGRGRTGK